MFEGFDISDIILGLVGLYLFVCGVATMATRKMYGQSKNMGTKYTEESLHAAAPLVGLGTAVMGLAMICPRLGILIPSLISLRDYYLYILLGGIAAGALILYFGYHKLVEKKK